MGMANGPSIGIDVVTWQKSSRSGNGGNCVEVARVVRDAASA